MPICGQCYENMMDGAQCIACNKEFHFHCVGINENSYRKLRGERKNWRCPTCKTHKGQSSLANPVVIPDQNPPTSPKQNHDIILKEIRNLSDKMSHLDSLISDVKDLKNELTQIKKDGIETNKLIKDFTEKMRSIEQRVSSLEKVKTTITNLQASYDKIAIEHNIRDQWSRMNNVEVKGIPISKNENLLDLMCNIGNKINYPISKQQINYVARIPTKDPNKTKPIIVCFNNRHVKEDFVAASRGVTMSPMTCEYLGIPGNQKVFINDHLTPANKLLLSKVKSLAKERNFQYTWVKHCKIMVRKDSVSPVLIIKSEKDLTRIV